jgi:hypothetical protein
MPITELVFIRPNPDVQLRKELDAKLPGVLSGVFSKLPKLNVLCVGSKVDGASEDTHLSDQICLFLREFTHIIVASYILISFYRMAAYFGV